jgi:antitoxin StbD
MSTLKYVLANRMVGMTALREPKKVFEEAGDQPVAVMNRNEVAGYFVPASAVDRIQYSPMSDERIKELLETRRSATAEGVAYLKDK